MSRASFGVAPPASAQKPQPPKKPTAPSRMPMEVGKAIKVKKLSPEEEKKLLEIGWERGQPIPDNLTDLMQSVRDIQSEATDVEHLPPPVSLDTPPLKYDAGKEMDISDLSPEQQEKYKRMMAQIFADAQKQDDAEREANAATPMGAGSGVAESIRKALSEKSDIEIEDDSVDLEAVKKDTKPIEGKTHCARCNFPLDQEDSVIITDDDRDLYLHAADSLQLFTKEFQYLNGLVTVTVRELTHQEQELAYKQLVIDHRLKRIVTDEEVRQLRMRYSMVLQVYKVVSKNKTIDRPQKLADWENKLADDIELVPEDTLLRKVYLTALKDDLPDSVFRWMFRSWMDFDLLQNKLEAQSQEPDFWKPRTEDS